MIGIFDSGIGGIWSMQLLRKHIPQYDICYLGDTAHVPRGEKDERRIHDRTFAACNWLFLQGCQLVILACNTASAHAIRHRQSLYPHKKVLSVTVPGVESLIGNQYHHVGLLATRATINAHIYESVAARIDPNYSITFSSSIGTGLVDAIEGNTPTNIMPLLDSCMQSVDPSIDALILGCTHYPMITNSIQDRIHTHRHNIIPIIDPSESAASAMSTYLDNHPELTAKLGTSGTASYFVTGNTQSMQQKLKQLFGLDGVVQQADLDNL